MKKKSIHPQYISFVVFILLFLTLSNSVYEQDNFSVSGEITYWWEKGQIVVWLLTEEERKKIKNYILKQEVLN